MGWYEKLVNLRCMLDDVRTTQVNLFDGLLIIWLVPIIEKNSTTLWTCCISHRIILRFILLRTGIIWMPVLRMMILTTTIRDVTHTLSHNLRLTVHSAGSSTVPLTSPRRSSICGLWRHSWSEHRPKAFAHRTRRGMRRQRANRYAAET